MRLRFAAALLLFAPALAFSQQGGGQQPRPDMDFKVDIPADDPRLASLKQQAMKKVDSMSVLTQQMVDMLFSFSELGFQEFETQKYLGSVLTKHGFKVTNGVSGIPSSWVATWT